MSAPDWSRAACHGRTSEFVFDTDETRTDRMMGVNRKIAAAKAVCATCPLRVQCLEHELEAIRNGRSSVGIFGGTTQAERRGVIPHGTSAGYKQCVRRPEGSCQSCRRYQADRTHRRRNGIGQPAVTGKLIDVADELLDILEIAHRRMDLFAYPRLNRDGAA